MYIHCKILINCNVFRYFLHCITISAVKVSYIILNFILYYVTSRHITSRQVTSHHITSRHVTSRHSVCSDLFFFSILLSDPRLQIS